jgi:hypothetical protein
MGEKKRAAPTCYDFGISNQKLAVFVSQFILPNFHVDREICN